MLLASSTPEFHSRVIAVASTAHREARLDFSDFNMEKRTYDHIFAYSQSKLANVYMANEIERRYGEHGLHGLSVHPGGIRTGLQKFSFSDASIVLRVGIRKKLRIIQNSEQGASTTVWAATSKELEGREGSIWRGVL